jgi:CDP-diglyceride synthetase
MKRTSQSAGRQLLGLAMAHAFLGVVLLLLAAAFLEMYAETGHLPRRAEYVAVGLVVCGAMTLIASYFLHRRRQNATLLYAASSSLNVIGWIALGLESHYRPIWWVLVTATCLACAATIATVRVRRALGERRLVP